MQQIQFTLAVCVSLAALTVAYFMGLGSAATADERSVIRAHEIEIVDANGIVRARLGTNLPDAVIDGQVVKRGGTAAGMLLYDSDGQERSGYVTMDPGKNVMLTLDSKQAQVGLLAAGPEGGATIRLWRENDSVEMRTDSGGARMSAVRDGELLVQLPETALPDAACNAYNEALKNTSYEEVLAACRDRFLPSYCKECIAIE